MSFSSHQKLDETETLVTIGDMTYVREVTDTDFYISSLIQSAYFLSLFELESLLSKQFNALKVVIITDLGQRQKSA